MNLIGAMKLVNDPPVKYFTDHSKDCVWVVFFCDVFAMPLCVSIYFVPCGHPGKGLNSWLLFLVPNCEFVTLPLVSWVRCGT